MLRPRRLVTSSHLCNISAKEPLEYDASSYFSISPLFFRFYFFTKTRRHAFNSPTLLEIFPLSNISNANKSYYAFLSSFRRLFLLFFRWYFFIKTKRHVYSSHALLEIFPLCNTSDANTTYYYAFLSSFPLVFRHCR